MVATCHPRGDCRSGARRIPRCAASHGLARRAESDAVARASLATRDADIPGGTNLGAELVRASIARAVFTTLAVIRTGIPHVGSASAAIICVGTPRVASIGTAVICIGIPRVASTGTAVICVGIPRLTSTGTAVICVGIPRIASTGAAVTRNNITCADTSLTALIRAAGTCRCIQFRRHTSRATADPNPSCATKRGDPAEHPKCQRPCRSHHASCAARAACRPCASSADSACTKH